MATPEELEDYRETFDMFDENGDGTITVKELKQMMIKLGQNPTDKELDDIMKSADTDGNGTLEFDEFVVIMQQASVSDEEGYEQAFKVFDKDNDGHVTRDELRQVLKSVGESLTEDEIDEMIEVADSDHSGTIEFEEFVKLMKKQNL